MSTNTRCVRRKALEVTGAHTYRAMYAPPAIVGPLANGKIGVLPAQTIVKQGGKVFIRGTVAPTPCSGKEF